MTDYGDDTQAGFETFREQLSPMSVSGAIRQALGLCWMFLPPDQQTLDGVRESAAALFKQALDWWASVGNLSAEAIGQQLADHLEIQTQPLNIMHLAELSMRQAMFCCHLLLPESRRTPVEVAKLVAAILERSLNEIEEDFRMFESESA